MSFKREEPTTISTHDPEAGRQPDVDHATIAITQDATPGSDASIARKTWKTALLSLASLSSALMSSQFLIALIVFCVLESLACSLWWYGTIQMSAAEKSQAVTQAVAVGTNLERLVSSWLEADSGRYDVLVHDTCPLKSPHHYLIALLANWRPFWWIC